jgi:hypothetical protein
MKRTYECLALQEQLTGGYSCITMLVWADKAHWRPRAEAGHSRKSDWPRIMPEQVKEIR